MNTKKQIIIIVTILLIGLAITGGSYAFWTWTSNTTKNVIFNTSDDLRNYVVYDEGESKFSGSFEASNSYTNGIHSTISIYKTNEAANADLSAAIHMTVHDIGANMKISNALKWVVTSGASNNAGDVIAHGNFIGVNSGDDLMLVPNIEIGLEEAFYTIWLWLDINENPSSNLSGETLDTEIWSEINQQTGIEDRFEIIQLSNSYQTIRANIIDNKHDIIAYNVTTIENEPNEWINIPVIEQGNNYNLSYITPGANTYYVWVKDDSDNVIHKSITISNLDNAGPSGTIGITSNNNVLTISLNNPTDSESGIDANYGYKVSTSSTCNNTVTDFTYSNNTTYTYTTNGTDTYYVCTKLSDVAGNSTYISSPTTYELSDSSNNVTEYVNNWADAFGNVPAGGKIKSMYTHTVIDSVDVNNTKNVTFDNNGTAMTTAASIKGVTGTLNVIGAGEITGTRNEHAVFKTTGGTINITNGTYITEENAPVIAMYSGEVNISGGNITAVTYSAILQSGGELNITSGNISTDDIYALYQAGGIANISGGTISTTSDDATLLYAADGTLNLSGGTLTAIDASTIKIYGGTVNITGGTYTTTSSTEYISLYEGELNISGGSITSSNSEVIEMYDGTFRLTNGTLSSTSGCTLSMSGGSATMSGGTINGEQTRQYIFFQDGGTFTMSGGSITSSLDAHPIKVTGTAIFNITGGTYSWNSTNPYIYQDGGTTNISGGSITSVNSKVVNILGGALNLTNGTLSSTNKGTFTMSDGTVTISGGTITGEQTSQYMFYQSGGTTTISGGAITASINAAPIKVAGTGTLNITGGTHSWNQSNTYIYIEDGEVNMSGGSISGTGSAYLFNTVGGVLNLSGGSVNSSGSSAIRINGGTMNVNSGTYSTNSAYAYLSIGSGTLNVKGGTITNTNAHVIAQNGGTVNITGGTLVAEDYYIINMNSGTANMSGGTFRGDTSSYYMANIKGGTFNMTGGTMTTSLTNAKPFSVTSTGTLNINSGTYTWNKSNRYIYQNGGTVNINGGSITGTNTEIIYTASGELNISSGALAVSDNEAVNITGGTVTITGGTFSSNATDWPILKIDGGTTGLSGGTFSSSGGAYPIGIIDGGTLNITGGTFNWTNSKVFVGLYAGNLNISGGSITTHNEAIISNMGGTTNITGGTFTTYDTLRFMVATWDGTTNISGGSFNAPDTGVFGVGGGVTNITNGTYNHESAGVFMQVEDGELNISGGTFTLDEAQFILLTDGEVNMTGGTVTSDADHYGMIAIDGGEFNQYGGSLISNNAMAIAVLGGIANLYGGTWETHSDTYVAASISPAGGTMNISGGSVNAPDSQCLAIQNGTINVTGGTLTAPNYSAISWGSTDTGTVNIGTNDATVNGILPILIGNEYAIEGNTSASVIWNYYDGLLYGSNSTNEYLIAPTNKPNGYNIKTVADTSYVSNGYRSYLTTSSTPDITPPTGTLSLSTSDTTVTASLTNLSDTSGIYNLYFYKISTSNICNASTTGFTETSNTSYNFTNVEFSPTKYVCVKFADNAGNFRYLSQTVTQ